MKYSAILLLTQVISLVFGLFLFILGFIFRFGQAKLVNNYVSGADSDLNLKACVGAKTSGVNVCETQFNFSDIDLGPWANLLGSIVIITGFVTMAMSVVGIVGVLKSSHEILLTFHDNARDELTEMVATKYTVNKNANAFTRMMNAIMFQVKRRGKESERKEGERKRQRGRGGECCGIRGLKDFDVNVTITVGKGSALNVYTIRMPPVCCQREIFQDDDDEHAFMNLMICATATHNWGDKITDKVSAPSRDWGPTCPTRAISGHGRSVRL
ncbi:hypothetical protein PoB_007236900 [Plakobranchus ocellatus]|uniref:Tetraspanin n=1 Tax=Plakobranchus ocellatus TaxID=259542 RepID=A0AAV4DNT6_9GAST|nr:hypothetical protein PoB_007236900 [Plakobranchus ocellatus]